MAECLPLCGAWHEPAKSPQAIVSNEGLLCTPALPLQPSHEVLISTEHAPCLCVQTGS